MTQYQIKNIFFICLTFFLFFADIALFALFQQHLLLILNCFVILLLINHYPRCFLMTPILLLALLSYLDDNIFGSSLIYVVPTVFLANYLHEHLQIKSIIPYILLITTIIIKKQSLILMHISHISWTTTIYSIIYNSIVLSIFILIHYILLEPINTKP